jgi:prevent-host-death family protein
MRTYNVHEAKTHLSRILADVERGEEVLIARNGQPIARVSPVKPGERKVRRVLGLGRGTVWFSPDYDQADAEIERDFMDAIEKDD